MDIQCNTAMKQVSFKLSGRSTGGTDKVGHLIKAINVYQNKFHNTGYVSVVIQLEDGALHKKTAKQIVRGYIQAAKSLERVSAKSGGQLDIDLGFVRL